MRNILSAALLAGLVMLVTSLHAADTAKTNAAPVKPVVTTPAVAPAAPAPAPAAATAAKTPLPGAVPDTFNRYGKIWEPNGDAAHPLRLNVQFPGVGELKVPTQEELSVRDKLEQLAILSDDQIRSQLAQWPPFNKMNLRDEGQMLMRIQQFKDQRTRMARDKARDLGLTLTPKDQERFEKEFWDKRLQIDREMAKQFEPVLRAREEKMKQELFRDFSMPATAGIPPKPKDDKPPGDPKKDKAAQPAPAPAVADQKKDKAPVVGTNGAPPMAQAPQ